MSLVPGSILMAGIWYFHRSYIAQLFPLVDAEKELKILFFLVGAYSAGITINSVADTPIALMIRNMGCRGPGGWVRRIAKVVGRAFWFRLMPDPRVAGMRAYLDCPNATRRSDFCHMVMAWTGMSPQDLATNRNKIIAHQHLVAHLKALCVESCKANENLLIPVHYSASLLLAVIALIPVLLASLLSGAFAQLDHPLLVVSVMATLLYGSSVLLSYVLKRQARRYFRCVITLALHWYLVSHPKGASIE
jgi:hypothetical protein